ncbi:MAG: methionyl-tRNA formyltransferase [Cohnella sp.]|jgi:methionyl-tRNA formyltransferase|nr:methionyl-tRNA formyltransferase [Cohnella sp.]
MRIVFMGTPDFAVPTLQMLLEELCDVVAVVTQPDRPKGRRREPTPPPVKEFAAASGLTVLQPNKLRAPEAVAELAALQPDLIITAAYGQILPKSVLNLPRLGCINVHGSLLPSYRGGAPIQRSLIHGETVTGVTLMYMAEGLDTGDMIARAEVPIRDEDTAGSVFRNLSLVGAELLRAWLPMILDGTAPREKQNDEEATYAPNLTREDEQLQWNVTAREVFNRVRGLNPMAGGFTLLNGEVFKVWACSIPQEFDRILRPEWEGLEPGSVLETGSFGIRVRTADGSVVLTEVQPAGKKSLPAAEFAKGARLARGTVLG